MYVLLLWLIFFILMQMFLPLYLGMVMYIVQYTVCVINKIELHDRVMYK